MEFQHLFLEQEVDSVPDNQCYKLYEDLCVQCLIALATHCPVSKEGFIFPEQFFGCIPAFIKIKGIRCIHLLRCDNNKVTTQGYLFINDLVAFPTIHELFIILIFMIKDQIKISAELIAKIQFHTLMLTQEQ